VYGGEEKVLDFTYVDDCVDGIARGVYALAAGTASNETINLAYGQGNSLVRAATLIADELGVEPSLTIAPSLLGERHDPDEPRRVGGSGGQDRQPRIERRRVGRDDLGAEALAQDARDGRLARGGRAEEREDPLRRRRPPAA
jgi:nucleoside-diphosphate-sugar epimerase